MALLVARDVGVAPPGVTGEVLHGFSLELEAGSWLALAGPNGGGKTTLALALAGLWPARRGRIDLDGEPVAQRRRSISVILQDPGSQLLAATAAEEMGAPARNLGMPAHEVDHAVREWSERIGLGDDLARDPRTLSAGRQQLVLLGAALVPGPRLLIADEPLVHLDAPARERALAVVRGEVEHGLAVVWVTQSERERTAADRVIWIGTDEPGLRGAGVEAGPGGPAASRTGEATGSGEDPPPGKGGGDQHSDPAIRVRVRPWDGRDGPSVRVGRAFELDVPRRGVVVLSGPNGCGKSVLLSAAAGLLESPQWEVERASAQQVTPIMATQHPEEQIFEERVRDELIFAAVSRGLQRSEALDRAEEALAAMGLEPSLFMGRRCWWLSGGERRIVEAIAAMISPASLLALDEPTAGLDPGRQAAMGNLIRHRGESGSVLAATQERKWGGALGRVVEIDGT
jgi:energy-coupling factor transport system ATP-binding protein